MPKIPFNLTTHVIYTIEYISYNVRVTPGCANKTLTTPVQACHKAKHTN